VKQSYPPRFDLLASLLLETSLLEEEDAVYRKVVEEAPASLGLDRASFWTFEKEAKTIHGTFGTDEQGHLRDERGSSVAPGEFSSRGVSETFLALVEASEKERGPVYRRYDGKLGDHRGHDVGMGDRLMATVWDGHHVHGFFFADNLLSKNPISETQVEASLICASCIGQNVSRIAALREARRIGKNLERERNVVDAITNSLDEVVFARNRSGRYVFANDSWRNANPAAKIWPIVGKDIRDVFPEELVGERLEHDRHIFSTGESFHTIKVQYFGGRNDQHVDVRGYPVWNAGGKIIAAAYVVRNITSEYESRKNLDEQRLLAESALRAKTEFVSVMNHELRSPLNAILAPSQTLAEEIKDPELRDIAAMIEGSANHLLAVVNGILDLSRIDAERMEAVIKPFDIRKSIQSCLFPLRLLAKEKEITFEVHFDEALPSQVPGDSAMISRIVVNLVTNAIKFTDRGGVTLRIGPAEDNFFIEVRDTGTGISDEDRQMIFEPFRQVGTSETNRAKGSGLGLAICKRLVNLMDGQIVVESEIDKGSCFKVYLPLHTRFEPDSH